MKAAAPFVVMLSAVVSVAAQPAPPVPPKGKVVPVQIIVSATHAGNEEQCKTGKLAPTTVLIDGKDVHHCVKSTLLNHEDEKKTPDLFKTTLVQLSAGDTIQWTANVPFRVVDVRRHPGQKAPGSPHYPFEDPLSEAFTKQVNSPAVLNIEGSVVQRYKVTFEIDKPGNRYDPDLICSM